MFGRLALTGAVAITIAAMAIAKGSAHAGPMSFTDFEPAGFVDGNSVNNLMPDGNPAVPAISHGNASPQAWFIPTAGTDEEIVNLGGAHGKVWRLSQGANTGLLGGAPHSPNSGAVSGETAGAHNDAGMGPPTTPNFFAQLDFRSATGGQQAGLFIDVSANSGDTRQAFTRILDSADGAGFDIQFFDTVDSSFNGTLLDLDLSYTDWHTIGIEIMFVDGLAAGTSPNHATGGTCTSGPCLGNDIVNIYVDGMLAHTGTTWESLIGSRSVDRLLFASQGPTSTIPSQLDGGLYFDNVLVTDVNPASVPEPGTIALFGLGLAGLGFARRRKTAA